MSNFKKMLCMIRIQNDETLDQMAKRIGISQSYLSSVENGNRQGSLKMINKIIEVYGLDGKESDKLINDFLENSIRKGNNIHVNIGKLTMEERKTILAIRKRQIKQELGLEADKQCSKDS